jgi:hypothetical protein
MKLNSNFDSNSCGQCPEIGVRDTSLGESEITVKLFECFHDRFQASVVALVQVEATVTTANATMESYK